jgi:hypothetical protein
MADGKITMVQKFLKTAKPLTIIVQDADGNEVKRLYAAPKQFSTGSVGYGCSEKLDTDCRRIQASLNMTVIGSKEWGDRLTAE